MRCQNCSAESPRGAKFCIRCATPFSHGCQKCGFGNPSEAKFCAQCAAPLDAAAPIRAESDASDGLTGERRHLTVLFCDLVGSTEIASHLDPEQWREIVGEYHGAAAQAIERFGGSVAQYLGDGVMAYFGWPEAHDNDAERAARAGLAILDEISKLNEHPTHPKLSARIGIDSGAVVVGAGARGDADVFGDTPNIAARVQAAAAPGTVVISADTHRLIPGLFVVEDRGAQALKGVERPVQLYRVVQPSGLRGRLEAAAASRSLTPFVGREDELRLLINRWERALDGQGQVVLIVGEPGIGKSRLVRRFHEQIAGTPHTWVEAAAGAFFQYTPFHAATEMLRKLLAWRGDESAEEQLAQLEARLVRAGLKPAEALPLVAPLLNLSLPARYPPSPLSPEQQRRRLLATLVEWVLGAARRQPAIVATEDLHWADPSTLELIQLLVEQGATSRLLLLYTARLEFDSQWLPRMRHAQITLDRLSARNARAMVEEVAAHKALKAETIAAVVERTGGVPLFVEELTRAVLESGDAKAIGREIPVTLHDSLLARLDRLGPAKEVAQVGAVLGGEFSYELLRAVHSIAEEALQSALRSLADAELLYARGIAPDATYHFKHALIRDAAYNTLLKTRRRELHQRIAIALRERFPDTATSVPELLAHHYTEAGLNAQALPYWRKAGRAAIARSANAEAIAHLRRGLELVEALPQTPELVAEEIRLQLVLTTPLMAIKGYTDAKVEEAYRRARDLSGQIHQSRLLFASLGGLFSIYFNRGEYHTASELGQQLLRLAETISDNILLLWSHYSIGFNSNAQGDFQSARLHLEQSIALYEPQKSGSYGFVQNPGPTALGMLAHVLHTVGYPDQALKCEERALNMARGLAHPYTLAWVLGSVVELLLRRGDNRKAKELAAEGIALCTQQGFSSLLSKANFYHGFALVHLGGSEEGIAQMRQGLEGIAQMHQGSLERENPVLSFERYLSAKAFANIGRSAESIAIIAELLSFLEQSSERWCLKTAVYRLKGDLLLMEDPPNEAEAEAFYHLAIELGRENGDKMGELQATVSLARLLSKQGKRDKARTMLAEIYGWFTEGLDTADLKEAKGLLDQLNV
jgi:class 3 adenylate cyclase/tetratricopeptide (TPR) repeat protein